MKYIVYCRKSTDEKDRQILSIEAQIAELTEFAKREGLEISEFITEAKTAKIPGREQFDRLLMLLEKGQAQGIISWHPDRLARNSIDGGKIIYLLDTGKLLDLKFPSHWFENTPQGKFMLSIAFSQSKYYIDNLSENVKRGLRQKLRNGVFPAKAPWGYSNNEKLGSIEIDPVESKIMKKAFQLFAKGNKTFTDIAKFLKQYGLTQKNGKPLKIDRIKAILSNKFYIGILFYNGEYYEGKHQLFISKSLFDQVQKQFKLTLRAKEFNKYNFSFLRLIKCGECGASITAERHKKFYKETNREVEYVYYRCSKKLKPCGQRYIQGPVLEKQLRNAIFDASLPPEWATDWYKWLERDEITERQSISENMESLKVEIKSLDWKLNLLLDSYLDNIIDGGTYKSKKNELFQEKIKKEENLARIKTTGSGWLELMKEFIDRALQGQKIARAKNTNEELAFFAKTVGSNFFLTDRQLFPVYALGFAELHSGFSSPSLKTLASGKSLNERDRGVEPLFAAWKAAVEPIN